MAFDPWAQQNAANQNLNQTLSDLALSMDRQQAVKRQNSLADLQMQEGQMKLAELQRQRTVDEGARNLADLAPTTATQFAAPVEQENTGGLKIDPSLTEITKPGKPQNHDRLLLDYYKKNDPTRASGMEKLMMDKFKALSEINPEEAVKWYSDVSGIDMKYQGKKGDYSIVHTPDGTIVAVNSKNPKDVQLIQKGTPKPDAETLLDKRLAAQAAIQDKNIAAADRRISQQIEAADRRASRKESGPGKTLPAGQLESIADMKRVKDVLAEAGALMKSTNVTTGPVVGRLQSLGAKVGASSDDFVNVQQKLQTAQNIMLKLRSGAAVTESEHNRFLKEFPTPNDTGEVFNRKMNNAVNYASTLMDEKMDIYEEGGYKVPRKAASRGAKPSSGNQPIVTKSGFKVSVRQ
jgi:hypothetical protein